MRFNQFGDCCNSSTIGCTFGFGLCICERTAHTKRLRGARTSHLLSPSRPTSRNLLSLSRRSHPRITPHLKGTAESAISTKPCFFKIVHKGKTRAYFSRIPMGRVQNVSVVSVLKKNTPPVSLYISYNGRYFPGIATKPSG